MAMGRASDWGILLSECQERINFERLRKYRLDRLKQQLKKHGIGALLCYSYPGQRYMTGLWIPGWMRIARHHQALLVKGQEPVYYARGGFVYMHRNTAPWMCGRILDSFWYSQGCFGKTVTIDIFKGLAEAVKKQMKEAGVADEPVGVDIDTPLPVVRELEKAGLQVVDGQEPLMDAKAIKNEDEIDCTRVACSIAEACFEVARTNLKPGLTENQLNGLLLERTYAMGAEVDDVAYIICSGARTNMPSPCRGYSDRIIRPGDIVYLDLPTYFMGYSTCYYRDFVIGKATQKQKDCFQQCLDLHMKLYKTIRPGITTKDVASIFPPPEYWGYKEDWEVAGHCVAHGIGLGGYDKPWISRPFSLQSPQRIEPGMIIAFEPFSNLGDPKLPFGTRLEDMVCVTETGTELLSRWPLELLECAI